MRLALDWGEARIGVAACDREGMLAFPVETVAAGPRALERIAQLVADYEPVAVVVGLPRTLAGTEGIAAQKIRLRAAELQARIDVPVLLSDERLTTRVAAGQLRAAGKSSKKSRGVIDQAAAVGILTSVLETERRGTAALGQVLSDTDSPPSGDKEQA